MFRGKVHWHRRLGRNIIACTMFGTVSYDLTPHLGGPVVGARHAVADPKRQDEIVRDYQKSRGTANRIAVVNCISSSYDPLRLPERLVANADYICFTDRPQYDWGVFDIRLLDFIHADPTRTARFLKTHLHRYLHDYDIVVWLDANAIVNGDLRTYIDPFLASGKPLAVVPHPIRNSIYDEAQVCKENNNDDPKTIDAQMAHYRREGFDCDDLIESNFFICRPNDPRFRQFCYLWWSEIDKHSRRDQLSMNYALRHTPLEWCWLFQKGVSLRNHPDFRLAAHHEPEPKAKRLSRTFRRVVDPYEGPSYARLKQRRLSSQAARTVEVVICVHDALDYVQRCLLSLAPTLGPQHRVILIDDGSSALTANWLHAAVASDNRMRLARNDIRQGYTKAANAGLRLSSADLVILLNSDTIVTRDWIRKLSDAAFTTEGVGIVGPLSNAASFQSIPNHRGDGNQTAVNDIPEHLSIEELNRRCETWTVGPVLPRLPLIHGFCLGIRREVVDRIGVFDEERFPSGYGEENDYCFRATDAGFDLAVATHTYVFHAKSKSYPDGERIALMHSSSNALLEKHGAERIDRAVRTMESNPILQIFRKRARRLYDARRLHTRLLTTARRLGAFTPGSDSSGSRA